MAALFPAVIDFPGYTADEDQATPVWLSGC
jgi:hypothetical protein